MYDFFVNMKNILHQSSKHEPSQDIQDSWPNLSRMAY